MVIAGEHQRAVLGISDPVVLHLLGGQVVVVNADAVEVHGTLAAPNGDVRRGHLGEVVPVRVLHHAGHRTVDVTIDAPEAASLLHHETDPHMLLFLELHGDGALLGGEQAGLGGQGNASPAV